jgi:hypothetical protein
MQVLMVQMRTTADMASIRMNPRWDQTFVEYEVKRDAFYKPRKRWGQRSSI